MAKLPMVRLSNQKTVPMIARIITVTEFRQGVHSKFVRRLQHVKNTLIPSLSVIGLDAQIYPAIIGSSLKITNGQIAHAGKTITMGDGCIGNLLSSYDLWKLSAEANQPVLVLEDDALLPPENAQAVKSALADFLSMSEPDDILYLLGKNPSFKEAMKYYSPSQTRPINLRIERLLHAADMSGTAAYCVKPGAARVLMQRIEGSKTCPTDGYIHTAFKDGALGMVVQTNPAHGFMLNDNWAEWNHKHDPSLIA